MSTWHQRRAGTGQLWHDTLWTVVSDPPEEPMCVHRFSDPAQAERLRSDWLCHAISYVEGCGLLP